MKDNITDSKQLLKKALITISHDLTLREVQFHIRQALQKIEQVEAKRNKKEVPTPAQNWNQTLQNNVNNPYSTMQTLNIIDQMIAEEKAKLGSLQARKIISKHEENDDETLFG